MTSNLLRYSEQIPSVGQMTNTTMTTTDSERRNFVVNVEQWLKPADPVPNLVHARSLRHEGTCAWLLGNPVFQKWLSGSPRRLWLKGPAGSGKTVLSGHIIDFLQKERRGPVISFFFDFCDMTKQTLRNMLQSLAVQLYRSQPEVTWRLCNFPPQGPDINDDYPIVALQYLVWELLSLKKTKFIVLDALDESTTGKELIRWINSVVSGSKLRHVHLLYTSRSEIDLPQTAQICLKLEKESVNVDIRSYVAAQLAERHDYRRLNLGAEFVESIQNKIVDGADGIFLWAAYQLDSLALCICPEAMMEALESVPPNLETTYQLLFQRIQPELAHDAKRLLQFMLRAKMPLTVDEARDIVATQTQNVPVYDPSRRPADESDLLRYFSGLVKIVPTNGRKELRFAHSSVQETLLKVNSFTDSSSTASAVSTCLAYLAHLDPGTPFDDDLRADFPFLTAASRFWSIYGRAVQESEEILLATIEFLYNEAVFDRWARYVGLQQDIQHVPYCRRSIALFFACRYGLSTIAKRLLDRGADVNVQSGKHGTAIQAASSGGHLEVVRLLLRKNANINTRGRNSLNAIEAASSVGYREIVELLLKYEANIDAQGGRFCSALKQALRYGHVEIVQLLLEKGANISKQTPENITTLMNASLCGYTDIVKLLLKFGAGVDWQGVDGDSALQLASCNGHIDVVKLLLQNGADVNLHNPGNRSALQLASRNGHIDVVQLLLKNKARIELQDPSQMSPLQLASSNGYIDVVQLLLENGANVDRQCTERKFTALRHASIFGYIDVVQLLLENGADVNATSQDGTALMIASSMGHREVVQLLLENGADVNATSQYRTALKNASHRGHREVVQLLLENGADVNATSQDRTALKNASTMGHREVVQLLLENGADVNATGYDSTALMNASFMGHREVVQLLLGNGADVNATRQGSTALILASSRGHREVVQLLLENGAIATDIHTERRVRYKNAREAASTGGHLEIVEMLDTWGGERTSKRPESTVLPLRTKKPRLM